MGMLGEHVAARLALRPSSEAHKAGQVNVTTAWLHVTGDKVNIQMQKKQCQCETKHRLPSLETPTARYRGQGHQASGGEELGCT